MSRQTTQRKLERLLGKHAILPSKETRRGELYEMEFNSYKQMVEVRKLCTHNKIAAEQKDYGAAGPFKVEVYLDAEEEPIPQKHLPGKVA